MQEERDRLARLEEEARAREENIKVRYQLIDPLITSTQPSPDPDGSAQKAPWLPEILRPHTKLILDDYQKQFNKPFPKDGLLVFPSEKAAHDFFQKHAEAGHMFLSQLLDENMNIVESGTHYSCGDGKLYSGTFSEIYAQLEKSIELDKGNTAAIEGLQFIKECMPPNSAFQKEAREQVKALRDKYMPQASKDMGEPKPEMKI